MIEVPRDHSILRTPCSCWSQSERSHHCRGQWLSWVHPGRSYVSIRGSSSDFPHSTNMDPFRTSFVYSSGCSKGCKSLHYRSGIRHTNPLSLSFFLDDHSMRVFRPLHSQWIRTLRRNPCWRCCWHRCCLDPRISSPWRSAWCLWGLRIEDCHYF